MSSTYKWKTSLLLLLFIFLIALINSRLLVLPKRKKKRKRKWIFLILDASLMMTPHHLLIEITHIKNILFSVHFLYVCIIYVHILHIISNKYWHKILCSFITEHGICNVVTFEWNQTIPKTQSFRWSMLYCEQIKCENIYDWLYRLYTSSIPWLLRKSFHFS